MAVYTWLGTDSMMIIPVGQAGALPRVALGLLGLASVAQMGGASVPETMEEIVDRLLTGYKKRTNPNLAAAQIRAATADDGTCPSAHDYVRTRSHTRARTAHGTPLRSRPSIERPHPRVLQRCTELIKDAHSIAGAEPSGRPDICHKAS